jgi:hypothetical protein
MTEHEQAQSVLGAQDLSAVASDIPIAVGKRCAQCGGPFGLIRRRRAARQFCSLRCVDEYANGVRKAVEAKARWYEFLHQRR